MIASLEKAVGLMDGIRPKHAIPDLLEIVRTTGIGAAPELRG